jgi:hypothetical protein
VLVPSVRNRKGALPSSSTEKVSRPAGSSLTTASTDEFSNSLVVLTAPDPEREAVRVQQEWMLEKAAARRALQEEEDANSSSQATPASRLEDDREREILRAQVNMLQQQVEELRAERGVAKDVSELPPAYEGSGER